MKAISIRQPYAMQIVSGEKTIETRIWKTEYRGKILIVSSKTPKIDGMLSGYALCIADLVDCREMTIADEKDALCEVYDGAYAWILENIKKVKPVRIKGSLRLYDVDDFLIEII